MRLMRSVLCAADEPLPGITIDATDDLFHVQVNWRENLRHDYSTGLAFNDPEDTISIVAGTNYKEQVWVVLHECSHVIVGCGHLHDRWFYRYLFPLCVKHGIAPAYFVWREAGHVDAIKVAEELGWGRVAGRIRALEALDPGGTPILKSDMKGFKLTGKLWTP